MTPATYSRGAPGTRIAFTAVPCALGRLLVAATPRGICRVSLGSGADDLEAGVGAGVPPAELRPGRGALAAAGAAPLRYLGGGAGPPRLPLGGRATAVPRRRWGAVCRLPHR